MRDQVLEFLLGIFPILGIAVPSLIAFKRKLSDEKYQTGGISGHSLLLAGFHGFLWGTVAFIFVLTIIKLLELRGIPATNYIRRFWE